ncbi:hypothetical protein Q5P01_008470 [Channa striata]|uniref:Uncharacterized protein n=1 Tax=Channa striata TaxID=64152 RepID=A0AA88N3H4_CHASR|nr:hypothetical protein Q5P01_008470 [Channa striata]
MVAPKGFKSEVTGSSSTSSSDVKGDATAPFGPSVINRFLSNNCTELKDVARSPVTRAYLCLDPTFGGGSRSCAGVCCAVEIAGGDLVAQDEQVSEDVSVIGSRFTHLCRIVGPVRRGFLRYVNDSPVLFYSKRSQSNSRYMLSKHVSAKTKLAVVLSAVSAIERGTLRYCDCVMSSGTPCWPRPPQKAERWKWPSALGLGFQ